MLPDKPPPHDLEAERDLLGAVLLTPEIWPNVASRVNGDFYAEKHQHIFSAMRAVKDAGNKITTTAIFDELKARGTLNDCGGSTYLAALMDGIPSAWKYNRDKVAALSAKRRQILEGMRLIETGYDALAEPEGKFAQPSHALPDILRATGFTADASIVEPQQIIAGVLHRGCKLIYGGPSKSFKSWVLLNMCISVAGGHTWMDFSTSQGSVLYINLELPAWALKARITAICSARGIPVPSDLHIVNLRGHNRSLSDIRRGLAPYLEMKFVLICLDPIYKLLQGRDENSAADIAELCAEIEGIALDLDAGVAFGAHYAKGHAAAKEHLDRMSGSGVLARDPDAILTATAHKEEDSFTLEMTLRNLPPVAKFVMTWHYPIFEIAHTLNPDELKEPGTTRAHKWNHESMKEFLKEDATAGEWLEAARAGGMSERTFYSLKREMLELKKVICVSGKYRQALEIK